MLKKDSTESGFTIVELLITLIVGAILVTGLHSIVTSQTYITERSRDLVIANYFVEAKVESLRSLGYSGLLNGTTDIASELPVELNNPRTANLIVSAHTAAIKKIVINLSYNEQGTQRSHSYTTLIGELGVGQY